MPCEGCGRRLQNGPLPPIKLDSPPSKIPISFIHQIYVPILRNDFLNALGIERIQNHFWIGDVFGDRGENYAEFSTLLPKQSELILRGNSQSSFRWCSDCATPVYSARGRLYALSSSIIDQNPVYTEFICNFIIRGDVWKKASMTKWRHIKVKPIEIKEHASDGLPNDLWRTPKEVFQNQWRG